MAVQYEWCYETLDDGDIVDNDFEGKLFAFSESRKTDTLCLVRNDGDEIKGLEDRLWAYVQDNKLPEFFSDALGKKTGINVPKKFNGELKRHFK